MSGQVSALGLEVEPLDDRRRDVVQIVPVIDGRSLIDLVAAHEEGRGYEPSGGYGGLVPSYFRFGDLIRYYLGEQEPWVGKPLAVLACDCGELGCWPLECRVAIEDEKVVWRDFSQPHRPEWGYTDLGPFAFAQAQYEAEVRRTAASISSAEVDPT